MSQHSKSLWERAVLALIAAAVSLKLLDETLPHLLVPLVVLAAVAVVVRLVFFHTRRW